jgi:hypothetical protein
MLNRNLLMSPRSVAFLGTLLSVVVLAMLTTSATSAQCPQWDVRGIYSIKQSNNIEVRVGLNQRGPRFSGNAYYPGKAHQEHGTISGSMQGDSLYMEIKWDYGETGIYIGKRITEQGPRAKLSYLAGEAYIKEQPNNKSRRSTWRGSLAIHCMQDE